MVTDVKVAQKTIWLRSHRFDIKNVKFKIIKIRTSCQYIAVFLKVGGIAPLGAILRGKGAEKIKGAIGGKNNAKGAKMLNY